MAAGWLRDTGGLYGRVFGRGIRLALRNWPVGLLIAASYVALPLLVTPLAAPLGLVGGVLLYLAAVACSSCWLWLVEQVIRVGRVRLEDVAGGFVAYLGDLLTVGFLLWGLQLVASLVLAPFPFLGIVFGLAVVVFFNAVPELIYLGRHSAAELLVESYRFIGENWIEWFPANVALSAGFVAALVLPEGPFGIVSRAGAGLALFFAMTVRGLLFLELASSSRRAREFRRRAAG